MASLSTIQDTLDEVKAIVSVPNTWVPSAFANVWEMGLFWLPLGGLAACIPLIIMGVCFRDKKYVGKHKPAWALPYPLMMVGWAFYFILGGYAFSHAFFRLFRLASCVVPLSNGFMYCSPSTEATAFGLASLITYCAAGASALVFVGTFFGANSKGWGVASIWSTVVLQFLFTSCAAPTCLESSMYSFVTLMWVMYNVGVAHQTCFTHMAVNLSHADHVPA